ncbi:MAG: Uma2 family endonuclease, partial [Cyanobacteria bacterium J06648_1]
MLVDLKAIAHRVTDDELLQLSSDNPETKFETTKERKLLVMSPQSRRLRSSSSTTGNAAALRGSNSGKKNSSLIAQVWLWNDQAGAGAVFDSSTGFILSNGAIKSPDVSWIESSRWNELTPEQQDKFAPQRERADRRPTTTRRLPPSHPDFVIELLSPS